MSRNRVSDSVIGVIADRVLTVVVPHPVGRVRRTNDHIIHTPNLGGALMAGVDHHAAISGDAA